MQAQLLPLQEQPGPLQGPHAQPEITIWVRSPQVVTSHSYPAFLAAAEITPTAVFQLRSSELPRTGRNLPPALGGCILSLSPEDSGAREETSSSEADRKLLRGSLPRDDAGIQALRFLWCCRLRRTTSSRSQRAERGSRSNQPREAHASLAETQSRGSYFIAREPGKSDLPAHAQEED